VNPNGVLLSSNIAAAALTDIGRVRTNNEDTFALDPDHALYLVCDGMGGMASGEVASELACTTVLNIFAAQSPGTPLEDRLTTAIQTANAAVYRAGHQATDPGTRGMGTTLVAAAFTENQLLIANVGDSRAYILQQDSWQQITTDHSYINELIQKGSIRPDQANAPELQRFASLITRAIGVHETVEPDLFTLDLLDGDLILLASDGLTRYLGPEDFSTLIDPTNLDTSCHRLIDAAKSLGGIDNITCLLLRFETS
jgi:serine/threonine protein phosphatase PrpC